jgi:acyl CoA:acetate/3-ketoacid CoA transferase alpha subunit
VRHITESLFVEDVLQFGTAMSFVSLAATHGAVMFERTARVVQHPLHTSAQKSISTADSTAAPLLFSRVC